MSHGAPGNNFMKKWIGILLFCALIFGARAESGAWLTDFSQAKKQAKEQDKRIVMLFTGLKHKRNVHIAAGILFSLLWIGTFITGIFFLPHE